jgi:farnesyl diphosphate synthase
VKTDAVLTQTPPQFAKHWLEPVVRRVNVLLRERLSDPGVDVPERLREAIQYACLRGGKRLRPALVVAAAQAAQEREELPEARPVWHAAVALEMIHCFSLVHDDLPGMDDDDLRRGRPTVHRAFGEATAILVGDALSVMAFETLVDEAVPAELALALSRRVAGDIGWGGVIAGQMLDIQAEGRTADADAVARIHALKTARLLACCCGCGAIAVGADDATVRRLSEFGTQLGRAFQAVDDLLDETGDPQLVGKRCGKDRAAGKATLPAAVGVDAARQQADAFLAGALAALGEPTAAREPLFHLAQLCVQRVQ